MEKNKHLQLPEIIFGSSVSGNSRVLRRLLKARKIIKIYPKIYSSRLHEKPALIVQRNLYIILDKLFPEAILSHRTALEGRLTENQEIFLSYKYTKKIRLPGVTVHLIEAPKKIEGDMPFVGKLHISSETRAYLENMQISRKKQASSKTLPINQIEERLNKLCQIHGEIELNNLRDKARKISKIIGMEREFQKLSRMISALLGTKSVNILTSPLAKARAFGKPYDSERIALFQTLFAALQSEEFIHINELQDSETYKICAFFESYFSNYIEGTEFEIDIAREIIFDGKIPENRPGDAHDILGTFKIVGNKREMQQTPKSPEQFLALLKSRHITMMGRRDAKSQGKFKEEKNRVGQTYFVDPELVVGTLCNGFEIFRGLSDGIARAMFMMFLVSEVHPFTDGNGRIARIMMNAELIQANCKKIIIPTVYRDDYLLALRALSRQSKTTPYIRMFNYAYKFSSHIDFSNYKKALFMLERCNAFKNPNEGRLKLE